MGCCTSASPQDQNQTCKPYSEETEDEPKLTRDEVIEYYQSEYRELRSLLRMLLKAVKKLNQLVETNVKSSKKLNEAKDALEKFLDACQIDHTWFVLGDFLADIDAAQTFKQALSKLYEAYPSMTVINLQVKGSPKATAQDVVFYLTLALINFTDESVSFTVSCAQSGFVPILLEFAMAIAPQLADEGEELKLTDKLFHNALGAIHNIARRVENRWQCTKVRSMVPTLLHWTTTKGNYRWRVLSLLTLSFVIDEQNNHLLKAKEDVLRFLEELLESALEEPNRRFRGYSTIELAEGLTQLAMNDNDKRLMAKLGAIQILKTMINTANSDQEQESAAKAFYVLSFNEENRKEIEKESETMEILHRLSKSDNQQVKQIAEGTLWEVKGKQQRVNAAPEAQPASGGAHVMISYQWDVQKTMIDVKNSLQEAGYQVWMDIENMEGSTLEAMAKAIENACVVIIGVSQKYKNSPNCRSEAEYTYQMRKKIIPLMMENDYKPDGWLGIILGTKLWIDFREKKKHRNGIQQLIQQLKKDTSTN